MPKLSKLSEKLKKAGYSVGTNDPDVWLSTGNHALNYLISGDFYRGIPNRRTFMVYGPSGTGKSFLAGTWCLEAQKNGYAVVYFDTEHALHTDYLEKIGVDLSEDRFLSVQVSIMEDATELIADFLREIDPDEKICFVMDSLTNLRPKKEDEGFEKGELTNDMGLFAKKSKQLITNINDKIGARDAFFVFTNHAYVNQDQLSGEGKYIPSGGKGMVFLPSVSLYLQKLKLKEGTETVGVRIKAEIQKTRFSKLGSQVTLEVPYDRGLDPYDGVLDILSGLGVVSKSGAWYSAKLNGELVKFQKKTFHKYAEELMEIASSESQQEDETTDD